MKSHADMNENSQFMTRRQSPQAQMMQHQHQLLEEKPLSLQGADPLHKTINELQKMVVHMTKKVSALTNEKGSYLQLNRELQDRNNRLTLKVLQLEKQLAASTQSKAMSGRELPRYSATPTQSAATGSLRPSLLAQLKGNRTPSVPKWLSNISQASSPFLMHGRESRGPRGASPVGGVAVQGASPSSPSPTATTVTLADLGCWSPAEQPTPTTVTASQFSVGPSPRAAHTRKVPYMPSPLGPAVTIGSGFQAEECRMQGTSCDSPSDGGTTITLSHLGCWSTPLQPTPTTLTASAGQCQSVPHPHDLAYMPLFASPMSSCITVSQAEDVRPQHPGGSPAGGVGMQGIMAGSPADSASTITLADFLPTEQPSPIIPASPLSDGRCNSMPSLMTSGIVTASQGTSDAAPIDGPLVRPSMWVQISVNDFIERSSMLPGEPYGLCNSPGVITILFHQFTKPVVSWARVHPEGSRPFRSQNYIGCIREVKASTAAKGANGVANRTPLSNLTNVQANSTGFGQSAPGSTATSLKFAKRRHDATDQQNDMPSPRLSFRFTPINASLTLTPRSLVEELTECMPSTISPPSHTEATIASEAAPAAFSSPAQRSSPASGGDNSSSSQLTFAPFLASNSPGTHRLASPGLSPRDCDSSSTSTSAVGLAGLCTPPSPRINLNKLITRSHVQRRQWGYSDASSSEGEASPGCPSPASPGCPSPALSTPPPERIRNRRLVTRSRTLHRYWVYSDQGSSSSSSRGDASPSWPSPVPSLSSPTAATPATWQELFTDGSDSDTSDSASPPASSCGSGAVASQRAVPLSQPAELHFISLSSASRSSQPLHVSPLAPVPATQSDPSRMGKQQPTSPSPCPCSNDRRAFSPADGTSLSPVDLASHALSLKALPQAVGSTGSHAAAHPTPLRDASSMKASSTGEVSFLFPGLPTLGTPDALIEANLLDEDRHSTPPSPRLAPATVRSPTQSLYLPDRFSIPAGSTGFTPVAHSRSPGSSGSQLTFAPFLASSGRNTCTPTTPGLSPLYLDSSSKTSGAVGLACTTPVAKTGPNKRVITRSHVQRRQWGDSDASSSDGEASPAEISPVSSTPQPARIRNKHLVTCSRTLHKYWVYSSDSSSSSSRGDASPSWPSPVPSSHSPTAATPAASRFSPLHLPRATDTFTPHQQPP
ncbi:hypothetical protein ABBQ38_000929 [Trebouxia sp. C0009 RCD-2024]